MSDAGGLRAEGVTVRYGSLVAVDRLDLAVPTGQVLSVLGPSGSGKSTLLRAIAGLERPSARRITWDGADIGGVPVHLRRFGLMFQEFALFPHRDVGGNVAFGLRMQGLAETAVRSRVGAMLALVGLPGTERRAVSELSGGEQQRVALARALAPAPRLLMLDEPLGSLDRTLRERLPLELRDLFRTLALTVLYVTHDQEEAFSVGDRVAVMRDGRIVAVGPPEALWREPPDEFVARFLGFNNIIDGHVDGGWARTAWGALPVPPGIPAGARRLVVRPDGFSVVEPAEGMGPDGETPPDGTQDGRASGTIEATVAARVFRGDHVLLRLTPDDGPSLEVTARWARLPDVGERLRLRVDRGSVVHLPGDRPVGLLP